MKKCLITPELHSAISWYNSAPNSLVKGESRTWKEKAYEDLSNKLNRVSTPYETWPQFVRTGIEFEKDLVRSIQTGRPLPERWINANMEATHYVYDGYLKDAGFQVKLGMEASIGGEICYLYGKADAIKDQVIVDFKTTSEYKPDKYTKSFQHKLYQYIHSFKTANIVRFQYHVFVIGENSKIQNHHKLPVPTMGFLDLSPIIEKEIQFIFAQLKQLNLWETYREVYCLY